MKKKKKNFKKMTEKGIFELSFYFVLLIIFLIRKMQRVKIV